MQCNWALIGEGNEHVICCCCSDLVLDLRASKGSSLSHDTPEVGEYPEHDNESTGGTRLAVNTLNARTVKFQLDTAVIGRSPCYVLKRSDNSLTGFANQILRVTKCYRSSEKLLHDTNYLHSVMVPWLSPAFCSSQKVVHLSKEFLEGPRDFLLI